MEDFVLVNINYYVKLQVLTEGDPNEVLLSSQTPEFRKWLSDIGLLPGNRRLPYRFFQGLPSSRGIPIDNDFHVFRVWNNKLKELHRIL